MRVGVIEFPLRGDTAILAGRLQRLHGDPADRIIVATAIDHSATLITADKKILDWDGLPQVIDARR
jgi:PIN domain nuclease of toxin-antitoxin system